MGRRSSLQSAVPFLLPDLAPCPIWKGLDGSAVSFGIIGIRVAEENRSFVLSLGSCISATASRACTPRLIMGAKVDGSGPAPSSLWDGGGIEAYWDAGEENSWPFIG